MGLEVHVSTAVLKEEFTYALLLTTITLKVELANGLLLFTAENTEDMVFVCRLLPSNKDIIQCGFTTWIYQHRYLLKRYLRYGSHVGYCYLLKIAMKERFTDELMLSENSTEGRSMLFSADVSTNNPQSFKPKTYVT